MNYLSWLLYFGNVSESLSQFLFVTAILAGIAAAISIFIYVCLAGCGEEENLQKVLKGLFSYTVPAFLIGGIVSCLLPTKQTFYLIAASEAGESVAKSQTGQKAIDAINRYLDKVGRTDDTTNNVQENTTNNSQ